MLDFVLSGRNNHSRKKQKPNSCAMKFTIEVEMLPYDKLINAPYKLRKQYKNIIVEMNTDSPSNI